MEPKYVVVFITVPDEETAQKITDILLERKLVACVNRVAPVHSAYIWEGAIHRDEEMLLICKTRTELVEERLVPAVRSVHPYQVPEIIALPIWAGHGAYLNWIDETTAAAGEV